MHLKNDKVTIQPGLRLADNGIYLNEDRYDEPKESFKAVARHIMVSGIEERCLNVIDVGCATGELIYHLSQTLPGSHSFSGIDPSREMIAKASEMVPDAQFEVRSVLDVNLLEGKTFDLVLCLGVLCIFDDLTTPLGNLMTLCKSGGKLILFTLVNDDDVDLICRYRNGESSTWEMGWNIFSMASIQRVVSDFDKKAAVRFADFEMPFEVKWKEDPMRTWTVQLDGKRRMINGAGLICNQKIVMIQR